MNSTSDAASPAATIVITTKNRKEELRNALASALRQTACVEVLVIDDGSTDGTSEMVRSEFPGVRLERRETSAGYIMRRNEGARLARGPIIISIDDDAAFPSTATIEQTLAEFDHPRIGAVGIPFINVRQDSVVRQRASGEGIQVASWYIGTAHAIRRDVFLALGGYYERLIHQGEELDFCIRMLAAGYVVRLGTADPLHHFESPRRDFRRMDYYGRRNDILYAWRNVPMPYLLPHLAVTTIKGASFAFKARRPWNMLRGLAAGYGAIFGVERKPVSNPLYELSRELKMRTVPLEKIAARLPAMAGDDKIVLAGDARR